jgi:hypothetical protein
MGLDQYLSATKFISGSQWSTDYERRLHADIISAVNAPSIVEDECPYITVDITVAQWRKANAIHNWFVVNVQHGEDDCGKYSVSHEQLWELHEVCLKVLGEFAYGETVDGEWVSERGVAIAEKLLPTTSGFFFGGTQYDDWYLEGLRYTKDILYKVLTDLIPNKGWKFEYSSSW